MLEIATLLISLAGLMMIWRTYPEGAGSRTVPNKAQMYVLTNEQFGFIASLVTTVNDVFSFQIPYPFYVNHRERAIIFHRLDFIFRGLDQNSPTVGIQPRLQVDIQYSDKEPAADWNGAGEDVEDENTQAMFDGPFIFGQDLDSGAPDADATIPIQLKNARIVNYHYFPPDRDGLDAFFPVTIVFTNMSFDRDLVDQVADIATFSAFESVSLRCYFTERALTPQEKAMMKSEYYGLVPLS